MSNDPRIMQSIVLGSLIAIGTSWFEFVVPYYNIALIIGLSLFLQYCLSLAVKRRFEPKSVLITSLSILLLLRANHPLTLVFGLSCAVLSKFVIRYKNKHIFNPANFGILAALMLTNDAWIEPGQWGSMVWVAIFTSLCGIAILFKAHRLDITFAFLLCYAALVILRGEWLGDSFNIVLHRLQKGSLLIFAFLMISDPRSTPNSSFARILWAGITAILVFYMQFILYIQYSMIYALPIMSLLVPVLDFIFPGRTYQWNDKGGYNENKVSEVV